MISVVLVRPETGGNVGAVARAMANFGFQKLVLIEPQCDHLGEEAVARSRHARHILENARMAGFDALDKFDYLVGTTSIIGNVFNLPRSRVTPKELTLLLKGKKRADIAVVFGPESSGLSNEMLLKMDFTLSIPAHKKYPSMNISHSAAIILYELFQAGKSEKTGDHLALAGSHEKAQAMKMIEKIIAKYDFKTDSKRETQRRLWKRMIGRSFLTKREYFALMGFLKRMIDGRKSR